MPNVAVALPPHILIIEDLESDYHIVHDYVQDAIVGKNPLPVVERVYSPDDIEDRLKSLHEQAKVLIIFDRQLELAENSTLKLLLDDYIADLWNTDHTTWRGQTRIVVYSIVPSSLSKIRNKKRKHHFYVSKLQRGANEPLKELQTAIQDCVDSL